MALFNESYEGRFNQLIQKLHGMKGKPPAPQIAPEILHVIPLEADRPEWNFLKGERLGAGVASLPATGAIFNEIGFVVPSGVNVLAELWIQIFQMGATGVNIGVIRELTLTLGNVSAGQAGRDTRQSFVSGGRLSGVVRSRQAGALDIPRVPFAGAITIDVPKWRGPFIVTPAFGYMVWSLAVNEALGVNFQWRERAVSPDELLGQTG